MLTSAADAVRHPARVRHVRSSAMQSRMVAPLPLSVARYSSLMYSVRMRMLLPVLRRAESISEALTGHDTDVHK